MIIANNINKEQKYFLLKTFFIENHSTKFNNTGITQGKSLSPRHIETNEIIKEHQQVLRYCTMLMMSH